MKTPKTSLLLLLCGLAATASAQVIYQDTFSRTGDLLGSAPDVRPGNETWIAAAGGPATDGSVLTFQERRTMFLPFTPGAGIYELSVDIRIDGSNTGSDWHAVGFMQPNASIADNFAFPNQSGGYAWALVRQNGASLTFAGLGAEGNQGGDPQGTYEAGVFHTITIRLDTTQTQWSYQAFVNGNALADAYTYPLGLNPNIGSIGLSTGGGSGFNYTYDNLTLIPEPSTYALIFGALAFGVILLRRRLRA